MNRTTRLDFWWPVTFGVTLGVEIMLSAIVLFGPAALPPELAAQLTNQGRGWVRPERDLTFFATGSIVTVLLVAGFSWLWRCRVRALERNGASDEARAEFLRRGCANLSVAATLFVAHLGALFASQVGWCGEGRARAWLPVGLLAATALAALLVGTIAASWNLGIAPRWLVRWLTAQSPDSELPKISSNRWLDVVLPLVICAVIYIPEWREFYRWYFQATDWCRHWSSFAMGPTLAFHYGKALGAETYSQYGMGWPVLFSVLARVVPLSLEQCVHVATIYGCLYFTGVYVFLRLALRHAVWAGAGLVVAISLQLYHGLAVTEVLWEWPSSTILRSPMDIWFFIALLLHHRTGRKVWAAVAGAFTGLAVFFETDTGVYLALTLAAYWVCVLATKRDAQINHLRPWRQTTISLVVMALVLLTGLTIASRGTILRPEFWAGWLEAPLTYTAGMSMLPIATAPPGTLPLLALFTTVYLAAFGVAVLKVMRRQITTIDVLLGCLAGYGLLSLILFVTRSEMSKIFHASVPFSLIVTLAVARWQQNLERRRAGAPGRLPPGTGQRRAMLVPWCALGGVALWLAANPVFQHYPGALQTIFTGPVMRNVKGPPPEDEGYVPEFDATIAILRSHVAAGRTVAVLDDIDTVFYLAAGAPPWWRFSPCFSLIIRQSELADLQRAIVTRGPEIILIRGNGEFARRWFYDEEDVWLATHQTVAGCYRLEQTVGNFEFWRRNEKP